MNVEVEEFDIFLNSNLNPRLFSASEIRNKKDQILEKDENGDVSLSE